MSTEHRNLPPLDINQRYTIDEAAAYLRISRAHVYHHFAAGNLEYVKDGRRRYVPGRAIAALSGGAAA